MSEEKENDIPIGFIIFSISILVLGILCISLIAYSEATREQETVEGKIIDTEFSSETTFGLTKDILEITMEDGSTYKIMVTDDFYDFTVNSRLILKLSRYTGAEYWCLDKVIKVPDN